MADLRPYSNREIDDKWGEIANALSRIEIQTRMTNGKVADLQKWRYILTGGMSVLTTILLPILAWSLWTLVQLENKLAFVSTHGAIMSESIEDPIPNLDK